MWQPLMGGMQTGQIYVYLDVNTAVTIRTAEEKTGYLRINIWLSI